MSDSDQEDDLLRELADVAKERAADDEAWEKLARGELSDEEAAALGADLPPEELETMRALYAPIDPLAKARIARDAAEQIVGEHKPRQARRWIAPTLGAIAVAALVLLFAWPRHSLPDYAIELSEGAATQRGDRAPSARYRSSDRLEILLRPATRVEGSVSVAVFDGDAPWNVPVEIVPSGAVRIVGTAGDLLGAPGVHELTFFVGREVPVQVGEATNAEVFHARVTLEAE